MLIDEAVSGFPLVLQLRSGNSHPGKGVAGILRWLFWRLKRAWPNVSITLRADGGFSLPEVLKVCERSGVLYAIAALRNLERFCVVPAISSLLRKMKSCWSKGLNVMKP